MNGLRTRWTAALLGGALALSLTLALTHAVPFSTRAFLYDFRAFACAGKAVAIGADPYHVEPLRACEHAAGAFRSDLANLTVPAPLPGFALAPFALLALLPFGAAAAVWCALSLAALAATGFALVRLSGLSPRVVWPAILLSGCLSLFLGQLVVLALAALTLAALALERRRYALAAFAACGAALEPHVALPALLAFALFVPRTRFSLAGYVAIGALLSLALLGAEANVEYFRTVLPAHTASELANEEQYSLAFALHRLGLDDPSALRWADISYVLALVLGLATTRALVVRGAPDALYALLPPAFVILAGPYVHVHHMAFAAPAALVLLGRVLPGNRNLALALVLLAVPWGAFAQLMPLLPLVAVVVWILSAELLGTRPSVALLSGLAAAACIALLAFGLVPRPDMTALLAPFANHGVLPEEGWKTYIDASFHSNVAVFALAKLPTLLALILLGVTACRAAFGAAPRRVRVAA